MQTVTTAWDRAPTDAELSRFYGTDKPSEVRDAYFDVLTNVVRKIPAKNLSLDFISYRHNSNGSLEQYPLTEVIEDYLGYDQPLAALMAVFEKSDCPLVQKFREAIAERFADANADEVEDFKRSE